MKGNALAVSISLLWLALALALIQAFVGVPFRTTVPIVLDGELRIEGKGVRASVPKQLRSALADQRGELLFNGRIAGERVRNNKLVKHHGSGRFRIDGHLVWFSSPDNSEIVPGDSRFGLRLPSPLSPGIPLSIALLLGGIALLQPRRDRSPPGQTAGSPIPWGAFVPIVAASVALASAIGFLAVNPSYNDGAFSVNGMPYSDAMGWNDLARRLAEGEGISGGFDGHRPFYAVFLGFLYSVLGDSILLAKLVNAFAFSAVALFAAALGTRYFSGTVGLGIAVYIAVSSGYLILLPTLLSEMLGLAFQAGSLYLFIDGVARERYRSLFVSGMLFGFSNLTRTFTLLAAPLLALVVFGFFLFSRRKEKRTHHAFLGTAALTLGVIIVFAPWLVRQAAVHGIPSISANSAELLYATANPELGTWSGKVYDEADAAGVPPTPGDRYRYFKMRYLATVGEDPTGYLSRVARSAWSFLAGPDLTSVECRAFLLLFAFASVTAAAIRHRSFRTLAAAVVLLPTAFAISSLPAGPTVAIACTYFFWRGTRLQRIALTGVVATVLGECLLSAMLGNFGLNRLAGYRDWLDLLPIVGLLWALTHEITALIGKLPGRPVEMPPSPDIAVPKAYSFAVLSAIAGIVITLRNLSPPDAAPTKPFAPSPEVASWVCDAFPESCNAGTVSDGVVVAPVTFGPYQTTISGGHDVGHWSRAFAVRESARTIAYLDDAPASLCGLAVEIVSETFRPIPGEKVLLVAEINEDPEAPLEHDMCILEAVAIAPWPGFGDPDLGSAQSFPAPPK